MEHTADIPPVVDALNVEKPIALRIVSITTKMLHISLHDKPNIAGSIHAYVEIVHFRLRESLNFVVLARTQEK
jgi:hypothetical protein